MRAIRASKFALVMLAGFLFAHSNTAFADPVGGPKKVTEVVRGNTTDNYTVRFYGGETTRITLSGDGTSCLELRVYDEDGNLVASDTLGLGDDRQVYITPRWTGPFQIRVKNLGRGSNLYRMVAD